MYAKLGKITSEYLQYAVGQILRSVSIYAAMIDRVYTAGLYKNI